MATTRRRKTSAERKASQLAALERAENGKTCENDVIVVMEFSARGIPVEDIRPRENVFIFQAWKAKGRYVRRGEHGVKLTTWIPVKDKETGEPQVKDGKAIKMPITATVFHISQTEAYDAPKPEPQTAPVEVTPEPLPEPPAEIIVPELAPCPAGWESVEAEARPAGMLF